MKNENYFNAILTLHRQLQGHPDSCFELQSHLFLPNSKYTFLGSRKGGHQTKSNAGLQKRNMWRRLW